MGRGVFLHLAVDATTDMASDVEAKVTTSLFGAAAILPCVRLPI